MDINVLVIGGGQAGLAAAYHLARHGISYLVVDQGHKAGEVWKQRYDSLKLFTPRGYSLLPGMSLPGAPSGYPGKDEIAEALRRYVREKQLKVQLDTQVQSLVQEGDEFVAATSQGIIRSRAVIIATGPFQKPYIPQLASGLDQEVRQLHSSVYRNPADLKEGAVLVIGGGNSGAQIAAEIAGQRPVMLAAGHMMSFMPLSLAGKSIFWWFDKLGILHASPERKLGKLVRRRPDPVFGFELKKLIRSGKVTVKQKATETNGQKAYFADGSSVRVDNVVWATGFRPDYSWLQIPAALDEAGRPLHKRGVSPLNGVYYVGLPWQSSRNSALIGGAGQDAEYVVSILLKKTKEEWNR